MTLDDLVALNEEIAALVRAGIPLESGLTELGSDMPGRLGKFAATLAERTARGESLAQAIGGDAGQLPPAYRAVVEAGVRAGRLPAALEAVAASVRRLAETQRTAVIAATYPLLVVLAAWCALVFFVCKLAPSMAAAFLDFGVPAQRFMAALAWAGRGAWFWGPIVPLLIIGVLTAWWLACTRSSAIGGRWTNWFFGRLPWMGQMLRCSRTATFLEILALLVENQTPLPEAITLAAEASGDPATLQAGRQWAAALASGQTLPRSHEPAFPPLVHWLFVAAGRDGALLPALRHAAAAYHRRARHQSDLLRIFLPIFLTVAVAGGATALYALALFLPYVSMLYTLAR